MHIIVMSQYKQVFYISVDYYCAVPCFHSSRQHTHIHTSANRRIYQLLPDVGPYTNKSSCLCLQISLFLNSKVTHLHIPPLLQFDCLSYLSAIGSHIWEQARLLMYFFCIVCLSVCLCVCLPVYVSVCLSKRRILQCCRIPYLSLPLFVYLFIRLHNTCFYIRLSCKTYLNNVFIVLCNSGVVEKEINY